MRGFTLGGILKKRGDWEINYMYSKTGLGSKKKKIVFLLCNQGWGKRCKDSRTASRGRPNNPPCCKNSRREEKGYQSNKQDRALTMIEIRREKLRIANQPHPKKKKKKTQSKGKDNQRTGN